MSRIVCVSRDFVGYASWTATHLMIFPFCCLVKVYWNEITWDVNLNISFLSAI